MTDPSARPDRPQDLHGHRQTAVSNAITGTIYTATTMSVVGDKRWDEPVRTTVQVFVTIVVLWLAHSYAHGMARRATGDAERGDVVEDLRESWPIVAAAFPQLAPMLLVSAGLWTYDTGLWISFGLSVVILGGWGVTIGRLRNRGAAYTAKLATASVALGLVLIAVKELVH